MKNDTQTHQMKTCSVEQIPPMGFLRSATAEHGSQGGRSDRPLTPIHIGDLYTFQMVS